MCLQNLTLITCANEWQQGQMDPSSELLVDVGVKHLVLSIHCFFSYLPRQNIKACSVSSITVSRNVCLTKFTPFHCVVAPPLLPPHRRTGQLCNTQCVTRDHCQTTALPGLTPRSQLHPYTGSHHRIWLHPAILAWRVLLLCLYGPTMISQGL